MLRNTLCETLKAIRQKNNTVRVKKDNLFWLTQSNCVWVDIVGDNKAKKYLLEKLGDMSNKPNMYDQNKDLIHSHLRPNTLPSELNQILRVPMEVSHPTFHMPTQQHSTDNQQHVNEGSQSPVLLE